MYLRKKFHDLLRGITDNYEQLKDPYVCLQVVTSYSRIPASYLRMLAIDYELAIRKDS